MKKLHDDKERLLIASDRAFDAINETMKTLMSENEVNIIRHPLLPRALYRALNGLKDAIYKAEGQSTDGIQIQS